ncbi:acetate kinase [Actinocatenispora thailandica]|uniref:Acetate kinase n=1 Tax=Actinocatenispora thailandica TaxID=227318 RepID=A0A7R7DK53_9ACTN|nr:acetate/propionate family kinase [Actinocatenispora thailandica]BCJ33194.1 acetate kinase [Actinocatenispora thailandica]
MRVLVVNAGSSSVKVRLLDGATAGGDDDGFSVVGSVDLPAVAGEFAVATLRQALTRLGTPDAVGHRVVHGGREFRGPVRIDDQVRADIAALRDLAPLHQDAGLAGIRAVTELLPDTPAVACFDTAFHADLPAAAATYPVPAEWRERHAVRRYGFHGLSHRYAARRAAELTGHDPATARVVSCHLGSGASLCAVAGGRSMDTTMGFTPLEGVVMSTRSGTVDPGLITWLAANTGLAVDEIGRDLEQRSGLLALAGTGDMREVLAARAAGSRAARRALDVYLHRLRAGIAAMTAALGGLDVLAFTGGIGEHAGAVRAGAAGGLGFLGVALDAARNEGAQGDADISAAGAPVRTAVVTAREDAEIAGQVRTLLTA